MVKQNTKEVFLSGVDKRRIPNSITMHIIPTAVGLKWDTPKDILISVIKNKLQIFKARWPIGHVSLELCDQDGNVSYIGQSTTEFQEFQKQVLKYHRGFGVLVTDVEGKLQDLTELKDNYGKLMTRKDQISFATFKLSSEKFQRVARYTKEFDEKRGWHRYGLFNKPLKGEGAGCSAFVSSCFQSIGLNDITKHWSRTIFIPNRLIGTRKNTVHAFKLLKEGSLDWFSENEPSYKLHFYDPEKMWEWYLKDEVQTKAVSQYQVAQAHGIVLDYTKYNFQEEQEWTL